MQRLELLLPTKYKKSRAHLHNRFERVVIIYKMKMSVKVKFILLFLLWLGGVILLWTNDNRTPFIVISGVILLRSFLVETKKAGNTINKKPSS